MHESDPVILEFMRWIPILVLITASGILSCDSYPFTREECHQLMVHLENLALDGLPDSQEALLKPLVQDLQGSRLACRRGETWSREGMDCALKATDRMSLDLCLNLNRKQLDHQPH